MLIIVKGVLQARSNLRAKALDGILCREGESLGLGKLLGTVLCCSLTHQCSLGGTETCLWPLWLQTEGLTLTVCLSKVFSIKWLESKDMLERKKNLQKEGKSLDKVIPLVCPHRPAPPVLAAHGDLLLPFWAGLQG